MQMIPMKACENCWETYEPKNGNQKYCSKECAKIVLKQKAVIRKNKSLLDGSGGAYLKIRFTILRRDNFTCQYCGRSSQNGAILHIDHIQPRIAGGKLTTDNLITSCFECNEGKRDVLLTKREQKKLKSRIGILCP